MKFQRNVWRNHKLNRPCLLLLLDVKYKAAASHLIFSHALVQIQKPLYPERTEKQERLKLNFTLECFINGGDWIVGGWEVFWKFFGGPNKLRRGEKISRNLISAFPTIIRHSRVTHYKKYSSWIKVSESFIFVKNLLKLLEFLEILAFLEQWNLSQAHYS